MFLIKLERKTSLKFEISKKIGIRYEYSWKYAIITIT